MYSDTLFFKNSMTEKNFQVPAFKCDKDRHNKLSLSKSSFLQKIKIEFKYHV